MKIAISSDQLSEDRFSRFNLITWWNQEKIRNSNILVIGAGALGNEILKNLALLGFQKIIINDLDKIENSNLSRSILYKEGDIGKSKADTASSALKQIYGDVKSVSIDANIISQVGLGLFGWADIVIAGMDNREARLWINRCCWKMGKPWVDGAIEGVNGIVRVFIPNASPCYECTLGEADWAILEKRMSCNMLTREQMEEGKTPTTPTTSSVIAGIQVQEAIKLLHGMPVLKGRGFVFEGLNHSSYTVDYTENIDCQSHETYTTIEKYNNSSDKTSVHDLFIFAKSYFSEDEDIIIEFSRDVIWKLICKNCNTEEEVYAPVGTVSYNDGKCHNCRKIREVVTTHNYSGSESYGDRLLDQMGLPLFDVFTARSRNKTVNIAIEGDKKYILKDLSEEDSTQWGLVKSVYLNAK